MNSNIKPDSLHKSTINLIKQLLYPQLDLSYDFSNGSDHVISIVPN